MPEDHQQANTNQQPTTENIPQQPTVTMPSMPTGFVTESHPDSIFRKINRITAIVLIISAVLFATISLLAIWDVFGNDTGEVVWRSFSSLATIALASLVVNVASKLVEQNQNHTK